MNSSTIDPASRLAGSNFWRVVLVEEIERLIADIRSRRRVRRTMDELIAFDDHTLADIGLSREKVEYAVRYDRALYWRNGNLLPEGGAGRSPGELPRQRTRALRQLRDTEDHILEDIGLSREDWLDEISKPFWR